MRALALALVVGAVTLGAADALADPSGRKWGIPACGSACPMGTTCLSGRCYPVWKHAASIENTGGMSINGSVAHTTAVQVAQTAFAAWHATNVRTCSTSWNSSYGGTFTSPAGLMAIKAQDQNNFVMWLGGTAWLHMTYELAITTGTYYTSNNEIFDADMELNNNLSWSTSLTANTYDVESVILHEAGHFLGLAHTGSVGGAVMFPTVQPATAKRALTTTDESDVCAVYPPITTAGAQGSACANTTECQTGLVCEGRTGATTKMCTKDCASATDTCPTGYACQGSTSTFACLPQIGAPDQCRFCQSGGDCSAGLCLRFASGVTFCSINCSENAQCGSGYTCQLPDGFCVPTSGACTNQCTTDANCATGYTCSSGSCVPRGAAGDPCTVSGYCQSCNVCTRESADSPTAYCRPCCAGSGQGGFCNACTNTTCSTGNTCTPLTGNPSSVCLPGSTLPTTCQTCNGGQCAQGLQCVYGRCRAPCNPASPGTCQACFIGPAGSGSCGCTDEIASAGEPCGQISGGVAICGSGLACVGSPSTVCRQLCDINQPLLSCPTGQACQQVNSLAVCIPGSAGSNCAPCTNAGQCNAGLSCYQGRCYQPCNVNLGSACTTCVQTMAGGAGVCGCADQISAVNEPCGTQPDVRVCGTGSLCINGMCRGTCNPADPSTCPILTECLIYAGDYRCVDSSGGGGGGGSIGGGGGSSGGGGGRSGGGSGGTGGGTGGGGTTDLGCGCSSVDPSGIVALLALGALARRRRSR